MNIESLFDNTPIRASVSFGIGMNKIVSGFFCISTHVGEAVIDYRGTLDAQDSDYIELNSAKRGILTILNYYSPKPFASDKDTFFISIEVAKPKLEKKIKKYVSIEVKLKT
ncbi:Uncharacterised protein [Candidatus Tiddalikarchaeum anstoanum]|nr:Uncharacterised protein [Candidatus Tiddalikarchaeum anstoanum]